MAGIRKVTRNAYLRIRDPPLPAPTSPEPSLLPLATYTGHRNCIMSLVFMPDSKDIVSGSLDGTMRVWSLTEGNEIGEAIRVRSLVWAMAASEDGKLLASGGLGGRVIVWDAKSHKKVVEGGGRHSHVVNSLSFSRDSTKVASASEDKSVIVWSTSTGERLAGPFTGHISRVYCVAFSPDAKQLASCNENAIHIWHSHNAELALPPIRTTGYYRGPHSLSWTPDGNQIIAGCWDRTIRIFDASNGTQITRWDAHTSTGTIFSIAVSRDGRYIVSGSRDNTVKLWDATTHQQIGPTLQHDDMVRSVCISPDAKYIASAGDDRKVSLWSLPQLVNPSYAIDKADAAAKGNEDTKSNNSNNEDEDTPKPPDGNKEATDEEAKMSHTQEDETESVRNFLDMAAVFSQDEDGDPLAFLAAVQGDLEQGNIDISKLDGKVQRRLFNRLQGALSRMKKAAESRPSKEKGRGQAREDATPTPDTATAEDTAQTTQSRKPFGRLRNHLKKHTTSRKGKERETSESPHPLREDAAEPASPKRGHVRKRGERLRQRIAGRREGQSTDRPPRGSSSSAGVSVAPIRRYKVTYGFMEPRNVAVPMPDPDDEEEKSWRGKLFDMICYCSCIPYRTYLLSGRSLVHASVGLCLT
ncbi:hypothetical protein HYDPIDRAFT_118338 [Hydnomerulius pinastri MD-312]|uniref:WD40 repeat-like protein n=1 Tax=Hydnomerulius pinastri MD-312 TaxID=994086 RepID=A0A0C9VPH7_9AGAM|nr:hypothetical protein HYDPIDRAFT_118338 [Hydnomerulius pinastri MD-312]